MSELRSIYNAESEEIRKEFPFQRWLKMEASFYDQATRDESKITKSSFKDWLAQKKLKQS